MFDEKSVSFSSNEKFITHCRMMKKYSSRKRSSKFSDKRWDCGLKKLLKRHGSTGSADRIKGSSQPKSGSEKNIVAVNKVTHSQEDEPSFHQPF